MFIGQDVGLEVGCLGFWVKGVGFRDLRLRVQGLILRGVGFRVKG